MALTLPQQPQSLAAAAAKENRQMQMPAPILLDSASARQYAFTLTAPTQRHSRSQAPSSSASSTMSSTSDTSNSPITPTTGLHPNGRRILVKFAPLPDPRKLEEDELDSLSVTSASEEAAYDDMRKGGGGLLRVASSSSAATATAGKAATLDGDLYGDGVSPNADSKSPRSSPRWSTKRLLRPLLPKASFNKSNNYAGDIAEGGSPLFRPSSMDSITSTQSAAPYTGAGSSTLSTISNFMLGNKNRSASDLEHQRARTSSNNSTTSGLLAKMTPLTHSISDSAAAAASSPLSRISSNTNSNKGDSSAAIRRTRSNSASTAAGANARRRFMLNGRVYGTRRGALTPDPFSHQRAYEQEFNEWGSGGLGSVPVSRAQGAAADWDRVRAGGTSFTDTSKRPKSAGADVEDDGSGMGWVRKRREARERAKLEEEARAKEQKAQEHATVVSNDVENQPATRHPESGPSTTDNPPLMEDPPGARAAEKPLAAAGDAHDGDHEHGTRPHSSATIRTPHALDGASLAPIPKIIVDDARSSHEDKHDPAPPSVSRPSSSSSKPTPSTAPAHHETEKVSAPLPRPSSDSHHERGEHMTEMAVVPPRPTNHVRRTDSTRRPGHSQSPYSHSQGHLGSRSASSSSAIHQRDDKLDNLEGSSDDEGADIKEESHHRAGKSTTAEHLGEEKDDAATLRQRAPSPPHVHRSDSGTSTSSASSDRSTEDDEEDDEEADDDDEDENEAETQKRLTAECAGVEKISRHREQRC